MSTNTNTTNTTNATYRRTKAGEWVVYGPASLIKAGYDVVVVKRDGSTKTERIESVGKPFEVNGRRMVYGYLGRSSKSSKSSSGYGRSRYDRGRKSCLSGGNCSSFGDGSSCGGWDCDGW